MFASCGYFRGLTCPYFQSGLCERPYCHFRHVKEKGKEAATTSLDKPVISIENIGNLISPNLPNDSYFQKAEKTIDENEGIDSPHSVEEEGENGEELVIDTESMEQKDKVAFPAPNPSFQPVYKPTPKSDITPRNPNDPLPEYCPTPIPELKKMHKTLPINLEYDPVSNFSMKEKIEPSQPTYVPIKRSLSNDSGEFPSVKQMRLDGHAENGEKSEYIVHDEICDSEVDEAGGAQFSDDESNMTDINDCQEENSFEEFFDTKSYARDTVRDKDSDSLIPNKLKKFDFVSGILGSESSEGRKSQKRLSDKENIQKSSSRSSSSKSTIVSGKDKVKNSEVNHRNTSSKHSVKSSSSSSSTKKSSASSRSSSKSSSSHTSSKSSSHKSESLKKDTHRHSSTHGKEPHKTNSSSGKSEKNDKSHSSTLSKDRHSSGTSSSKKGDKSPRSSSSSSISKTNGKSDSKSDKRHLSGDKSKSTQVKHNNDLLKKHHSSGDKVKSDKHHSSSDKSKSSKSSSDKHQSSSDKAKSSSDKHHNSKTSSKSSHSSSSSKTKHNSGSQSDSSKSKNDSLNNSRSPKSITDNSHPNKRYSIEDIHNDLFGDTDESDNDKESIMEEPVADMPDSEIFQYLDESDFSDADTYEECLKIFNETTGSKSKSPTKKDIKKKPETSTDDSVGKKRLAYEAASKVVKKPVVKAKSILSPAQVMHNRIIAMQKQALEAAAARKAASETPTATAPSASSAIKSLFGGSKQRVAHNTAVEMNNKTKAITASKSEKRQQHTPTIKNLKRPTVPAEYGSKVPTAIRQRYLNLIIDECLKFIKDEELAFKRGQEEEHVAYGRSSNKNIYLRMAVNTIKRLRSEADMKNNSPKKVVANAQSHEATLGGSRAAKTSFTLKRSGAHQTFFGDFSGAELYKRLCKYVTSEEDLQTNNYPRPDPNSSSSAKFYVDNNKVKDPTLKDYEKICNRCGKRFVVYPDCEYGSFEECSFHWGKAWKRKVAGQWETRYTCCSGDLSATGCAVSKAHTYESNKYENITGYMKTMPTSPPLDGNYGVYAMDCEMVYTTGGMELARVTVIDSDKQPVYETLVKPDYPLIDPNTRYSGIEEKDLDNVKTTLRNVQAVLLSLFNDKTILMGHSLESDLMAVKIIHNTVVDTSLVFPHRLGLPYKRALRNLMSEHLQKIIQNDEGGHDSNEDALACLELMQWRLKEDAKREHRRS